MPFLRTCVVSLLTSLLAAGTALAVEKEKATQTLKAAADPDYAPIEFLDAQGRHRGLAVDYWTTVAKSLDLSWTTLRVSSWDKAVRAMQEGRADVILAAAITEDRRRTGVFSDPFLSVPLVYIGTRNLDLTKPVKAALVRNYAVNDWLRERHPTWTPVYFPSVREALEAVSLNNADLTVLDLANASYWIDTLHLTNLAVLGESGFRYDLAFWLHRRWEYLIPKINRALASISPREREALYRKWIHLQVRDDGASKTFWLLAGLAAMGWLAALAGWVGFRRTKQAVEQEQLAQQQAQASMRVLTDELRVCKRALGLSHMFYLVLDEQGIIVDCSVGAQEVLGYRRQAVEGKSIRDLVHSSDHPLIDDMVASIRHHPDLTPQLSVQFVPHQGDRLRLRLTAGACVASTDDAPARMVLVHRQRLVGRARSQDSLQGYLHRQVEELPEGHTVMDALADDLNSDKDGSGVLLLFQWDNGDTVMEEHGEEAWNKELLELFQMLLHKLQAGDRIAHLGLGRFALLLPTHNEQEALALARTLQDEVDAWNRGDFRARPKLQTSIGMTVYETGDSTGEVLHRAKQAASQSHLAEDQIVMHKN